MNIEESDDEYEEFVPITLEQFELLKKNSKKNNFLCDYSDQINGKMVLPSLAIKFPRSISNQAKHLKKQLESLEKENKTDKKKGNSSFLKEKSETNDRFSENKTNKNKENEEFSGSVISENRKNERKNHEKRPNAEETKGRNILDESDEIIFSASKTTFPEKNRRNEDKMSKSSEKSENHPCSLPKSFEKMKTIESKLLEKPTTSSQKKQHVSDSDSHDEVKEKSKKITSTHYKKEKKESETNSEFSLNEEKPKKMPEKKKEEENLKKMKKNAMKKSSDSSDSSFSSKKQPNLHNRQEFKEDKTDFHSSDSLKKNLQESVLYANDCSDSEEDHTIDLEKKNIISCLPKDFDKKKEKGLALKFKLSCEAHFYITHSRTKELRKRIASYIRSQDLKYSITKLDEEKKKAFFVIEAENVELIKNLKKTHNLLKKYLKEDLSIESYNNLAPKDYHAFKKIFHNKAEENKFREVSFLHYRHEREDLTALVISFNKELNKEMIKFLKERETMKIGIMKVKYGKFDKNKKRTTIEKRKDYKVLVDEGKLVKKYFEKQKKEFFNDMETEETPRKYNCRLTVFESSKEERAYNTSLIFHWKTERRPKIKEKSDDLDKFFRSLKDKFYFRLRFCSFVFKEIVSWDDVPHFPEKNDCIFLSNFKSKTHRKIKLNVFGDPGKITDFLEEETTITFFKIMKENSQKMKMILKMHDLDGEGKDFFKFHKEFPKVIKEAKKYKEEETCNYLLMLFKKEADYSQILQTILKILAKGFPRFDKNNNNRKEKKRSSSEKEEEEEKKSQTVKKKQSMDEKATANYRVSDDESDEKSKYL